MRTLSTILLICLLTLLFAGTLSAQWVQTGPYGGNIRSIAVSGTNIFAGTANGVFLSTDNGSRWSAVNSGLDLDIHTLGVSVTGIFAGTSTGVFLSTNNGGNWGQASTGLPRTSVTHFAVSGSPEAEILFAGTDGSGVFSSYDNGTTWIEVNNGLTNRGIRDLAILGENIFAATWGDGVFRSTNNGANWFPVNNGLHEPPVIQSLAISGINIFASDGWGNGIFRSTDYGANWSRVDTGLPASGLVVYDFAAFGSNLFIGTYSGGMFLSTDDGESWTHRSTGLPYDSIYHRYLPINVLVVSDNNLFAGTNVGVYFSSNNGVTWTEINKGIIGLRVTSIAAFRDRTGSTSLFAAANSIEGDRYGGGKIYKSMDYGTSWTPASRWHLQISTLATDSNGNLFSAVIRGVGCGTICKDFDTVYRSTNRGESWTSVTPSLEDSKVQLLAAHGNNLFMGTVSQGMKYWRANSRGILMSSDNGDTWVARNNGLTDSNITAIAFRGANIFAGTGISKYEGGWNRVSPSRGIFLSTNNGEAWTQKSMGLKDTNITALVVSGINIYAGTADSGVFISIDDGDYWRQLNSGLTESSITCFAVSGSNIFVGTQHHVFLIAENDTIWKEVNSGWVDSGLTTLIVSDSVLFAGTASGVWKRPLSEMITDVSPAAKELPRTFLLNQNYPNPFNPSTTINYQLPTQSYVTLKVFDVLGREVATLVNTVEQPGYKTVKFNASNLPSGLYFYRLQAGNYVETKKLLLLR